MEDLDLIDSPPRMLRPSRETVILSKLNLYKREVIPYVQRFLQHATPTHAFGTRFWEHPTARLEWKRVLDYENDCNAGRRLYTAHSSPEIAVWFFKQEKSVVSMHGGMSGKALDRKLRIATLVKNVCIAAKAEIDIGMTLSEHRELVGELMRELDNVRRAADVVETRTREALRYNHRPARLMLG